MVVAGRTITRAVAIESAATASLNFRCLPGFYWLRWRYRSEQFHEYHDAAPWGEIVALHLWLDGSSMLWLIPWFQGIDLKSHWLIIASRIVCGIVGIIVIIIAVLVAFAVRSTKRGRASKSNRQM